MANAFFNFKQFSVHQDRCAMKVGVDGVLLGAWASKDAPRKILDIGTGTGLIALMLAQRYPMAVIHAIDIDADACAQAGENITQSPWHDRIKAEEVSLQAFARETSVEFDFIVSNPPYFNQSFTPPNASRTNARHTSTLTHEELMRRASGLLASDGVLCLILPLEEAARCIETAPRYQLFCTSEITVYHKPNALPKRKLLAFSKTESFTKEEGELTIETDKRHIYTNEYTALVQDFYLKM